MKYPRPSRRQFIQRNISILTGVFGSTLLAACGTKEATQQQQKEPVTNACEDLSGLEETDLKTREGLGYVKLTLLSEEQCDNCNLWLPPSEGKECGGCTLIKGPIYPTGYCTYWAPQV
ncbi:MAG: high-potential iron-sulfur protein [Bacteroidetes bacterium]|nr:high-potential iron-sulfur protein [Bacteroidota bacterium]MDA1120498.1 high-potential iron-sulfur protein [Bacteroidota bacterium]